MDGDDTTVRCVVNGTPCELQARSLVPLADALRAELGLMGTKLGCRAGDCGSCTVMVDGVAIASCLMPVAQAEGREIITVEGLGGPEAMSHPLQVAFAANNASQCGYCIPGFLVAAAAAQADGAAATRDEIVANLAGNLCRCTGYESIVAAIEQSGNETIEAEDDR